MRVRAYKKGFDYSYALGVFPTLELLDARPNVLREVILSPSSAQNKGAEKIRAACKHLGKPLRLNNSEVITLSKKGNCLAIGVFSKYEMCLKPQNNHLVLVNPGDAGNLGTVTRTMLAFGMRDLAIIRPGADVFDPRTIRASMGAVFKLEIQYFDSFDAYKNRHDRQMYAFMLGKDSVHLDKALKHKRCPYSLIFGNESSGLPQEYSRMGTPVVIPHSGDVDSLNLAVAVGIGLYTFAGAAN